MDIQATLTRLGYAVAGTASSGEEALVLAEQTRPDCVLMDIMLRGEIDGVDAAAVIRERWDIPVVFLTAYTDDKHIARATATEPFGFIIKPFHDRELKSSIEIALYKHRAERELRARERWYATTLRSIGDGVISADVEQRVTFMNGAAERLTALARRRRARAPLRRGVQRGPRGQPRAGRRSGGARAARAAAGAAPRAQRALAPRRRRAAHRRFGGADHRRRRAAPRGGGGVPRRRPRSAACRRACWSPTAWPRSGMLAAGIGPRDQQPAGLRGGQHRLRAAGARRGPRRRAGGQPGAARRRAARGAAGRRAGGQDRPPAAHLVARRDRAAAAARPARR